MFKLFDISWESNCNFILWLNIFLSDTRIVFGRNCKMEIVTWGNIKKIILLQHNHYKCNLINDCYISHVADTILTTALERKCKLPKYFQTNVICIFCTWLICVNHSCLLNSLSICPVLLFSVLILISSESYFS